MTTSVNREALRAPNLWERVGELRAVVEPVRLLASSRTLAGRRTANVRTVIVLPGLGATDRSTAPLRSYLSRLGHRAVPWNLGQHGPDVEVTIDRFVPRVVDTIDRFDEPVALIGWSLGGVVARETARELNRERPRSVSKVVTFGTPIEGPRHTSVARVYSPVELDRIDAVVAERRGQSLGCPVVAIHSRNDGIVGWRTCIDFDTPDVTNVEVSSSHLGMGLDPDVWSAIADALD